MGRFKVKGWKKVYHANINPRKALLISDKTNSEQRKLPDRKDHYSMIKGLIHKT